MEKNLKNNYNTNLCDYYTYNYYKLVLKLLLFINLVYYNFIFQYIQVNNSFTYQV